MVRIGTQTGHRIKSVQHSEKRSRNRNDRTQTAFQLTLDGRARLKGIDRACQGLRLFATVEGMLWSRQCLVEAGIRHYFTASCANTLAGTCSREMTNEGPLSRESGVCKCESQRSIWRSRISYFAQMMSWAAGLPPFEIEWCLLSSQDGWWARQITRSSCDAGTCEPSSLTRAPTSTRGWLPQPSFCPEPGLNSDRLAAPTGVVIRHGVLAVGERVPEANCSHRQITQTASRTDGENKK